MKENKSGIILLSSVFLINLLGVLFLPEYNYIYKILSVSFGGVAVSLTLVIITYMAEEKKSLYNFYNASEQYVEKIYYFSGFVIEVNAMMDNIISNKEEFLYNYLCEKINELYNDIYCDYIILQEETRKYEGALFKIWKKRTLVSNMRSFYDSSKDDINYLRSYKEFLGYKKLQDSDNREEMHYIYKELFELFDICQIYDVFILNKCKKLYMILDEINQKYKILSKKQSGVCRVTEYKLKNIFDNNEKIEMCKTDKKDNDISKNIAAILKSYMPSEKSTRC